MMPCTTFSKSKKISETRLAEIDRALKAHVNRGHVAGFAAMLVQHDQIIYQAAHGVLDIETQEPMPHDAIFRIASMTKPVTSVAVMMLVEEGYFDLDTPIFTFIPAFKDAKVLVETNGTGMVLADLETEITVRHLFTHTSGVEGYFEDEGTPIERMYYEKRTYLEKSDPPLTLSKMMEAIASIPLACQPNTHWAYGLGLDILAYLVELASGMPFMTYLQTRIFDPLNMVDTAYHIPPEKTHRLARVHRYSQEKAELTRHEFAWMDVPSTPPSYVEGGNLLVSTLKDYGRFAQMLLNRGELDGVRLLRPETVDLIASNHVPHHVLHNGFQDINDGYGFGLGIRVQMSDNVTRAGSQGEYGWGGLYSTVFWVDPAQSLKWSPMSRPKIDENKNRSSQACRA
ncbi:MAG: serine hydrolase domain-containing protein [Caldilineaceae bacterium]